MNAERMIDLEYHRFGPVSYIYWTVPVWSVVWKEMSWMVQLASRPDGAPEPGLRFWFGVVVFKVWSPKQHHWHYLRILRLHPRLL